MPGSGQRLGQVRPYTIHTRGPSRCDIGNHILWLNDVNGKWVRWCLHTTSENMVAFALSLHVESKATMIRGDAPMADLSSARRDEPSTCRALRAQRRPRSAASHARPWRTDTSELVNQRRRHKLYHASRHVKDGEPFPERVSSRTVTVRSCHDQDQAPQAG